VIKVSKCRPEAGKMSNAKVLVVDDNLDVGRSLSDLLFPQYHDVTFIEDSLKALDCLKSRSFQLILIDVQMPGIPGTELTRRIRELGIMTPIVFLTGLVTKEILRTALRLGVMDVLEKSMPSEELLFSLASVLEREKQRTEADLTLSK
jgi:two-component system, OmpR family, response regulator PfeR